MSGDVHERVTHLGENRYLVRGRHGIFLAMDNDAYLGRALMRYGEYNEQESLFLMQMVQPGMTVVEVGANIGSHSVALARAVGSNGLMVAIEPQPEIFRHLCTNLALNGLHQVVVHACGCGAGRGEGYVPDIAYGATKDWVNSGGVSMSETPSGAVIPVVPLDELLGERPVHLIKIDVEGMEGEVLAGASATLARSRPILYVENDRVDKSAALIRQILAAGYRLWWHIPPLYNPDNWFGLAENDFGNVASFNMVCLPVERVGVVHGLMEVTDPEFHPLKRFLS